MANLLSDEQKSYQAVIKDKCKCDVEIINILGMYVKMQIVLIRHGKTKSNLENIMISNSDEQLCQEGIDCLRNTVYPSVCKLISSPMKRCIQTASIIYPDKPIQINKNLREFFLKHWEGQQYENMKSIYQQYFDEAVDEQIQSYIEQTRMTFEKLIYDNVGGKSLGIVTHGGQIKVILSQYVHPKRKFSLWKVKNGSAFKIYFDLASKKAFVLSVM